MTDPRPQIEALPCLVSGEIGCQGEGRHYIDRDAVLAILAASKDTGAGLDTALIRAAIDEACPLINPRLSEVDWEDVAKALAARLATPEEPPSG